MQKHKNNRSTSRKIRKALQKTLAGHRCDYDAEGRAIIHMTVQDDSSFLSVYSEHATPVISTEVADFLENSTRSLHPGQPLTLRIHSNCIDDREKADYRMAIQEYYSEKYSACKKEFRFNLTAVFFLTIAGILTLLLAFQTDHPIWSEVIDIAAWVFLWEAVDTGVFKNRESNANRKRYLSYIAMNVEYLPFQTKKP